MLRNHFLTCEGGVPHAAAISSSDKTLDLLCMLRYHPLMKPAPHCQVDGKEVPSNLMGEVATHMPFGTMVEEMQVSHNHQAAAGGRGEGEGDSGLAGEILQCARGVRLFNKE